MDFHTTNWLLNWLTQSSLGDDTDEKFAVVFAAMGVKNDVADFFKRSFEESGALEHTVMFLNMANDPVCRTSYNT